HALVCRLCFFFFQAEDGIRDRNVTGVQTCALPISTAAWHRLLVLPKRWSPSCRRTRSRCQAAVVWVAWAAWTWTCDADDVQEEEIGRASCRERVWRPEVAGAGRVMSRKTQACQSKQ